MTSLLPTAASSGRPEPVLDAAKLAAAVSGTVLSLGALLVLVGWATADQVQSWAVIAGGIVTSIGALLAVAMPLITALGARAQVTPLAAPVSVQGLPLVTAAPAAPADAPAPAAAVTPSPAAGGQEITDALHTLEQADTAAGRPWSETTPITALGSWTPPTPAATEAEPTPIGSEAEAAAAATPSPIH